MQKQNTFYVLRFNSSRLKEYKNNIQISLKDARNNSEVVKIFSNQVIRSLFRIQNRNFDNSELQQMIKEKRKLSKLESTSENKNLLKNISNKIDNYLFVDDLIYIIFDHPSHYEKIVKNGLWINDQEYVRCMSSSSNIRKNTILFIKKQYKESLSKILNNGRDESIKLNPGKFNAYYGLSNSGSMTVEFPEKMAVVEDYEYKRLAKLDWVEGSGKTLSVEEVEKEVAMNVFDGAGLVLPSLAERWAKNLGLEYLPAWYIIRCNFMKGLVSVFDFQLFSELVAKKNKFIDIYGDEIDINSVELIVSESQFKLYSSFKNTKQYIENCKNNHLDFGVVRACPEKDKRAVWSNYQFLQVLTNLNSDGIKDISKNSIEYINDLLNDNKKKLLYMMGNNIEKIDENDNSWFSNLQDNITKSLFFTDFSDPYINQVFHKNINKTIKEMYLGKLLFKGNFSAILPDGFAFCEHIFNMDVKGLVPEYYCYSNFWNNENVKRISCARSPLTVNSEINNLNLIKNNQTEFWFQYYYSGIVLSPLGIDSAIFSDCDGDGDLLYATNDTNFINSSTGGNPVSYEKKSVEKVFISDDKLIKSDVLGFNSKIGMITNLSSAYHCFIQNFEKNSKEYLEIERRLKFLRLSQGQNIDRVKGQLAEPLPNYYTSYQKLDYSLPSEELEQIKFENSLVLKRRPLFFRHLYPHYNVKYQKELSSYDFLSKIRYGMSFDQLRNLPEKTDEQEKLIQKYYDNSFFLHNSSIMNSISSYVESQIKEIKIETKNKNKQFDSSIYMSKNFNIDQEKLSKLRQIYKEYNSNKKAIRENNYDGKDKEMYSGLDEYIKYLQDRITEEITSNIQELANLCVYLNYVELPNSNKEFTWRISSDGIILNLIENYDKDYIEIPLSDENGDIEYLFTKYKMKKIYLSDLEL